MKILILQLARLGDIYQTWPVLRALKRQHQGSEIHVVTRSKFAPALMSEHVSGLVDRHWLLETKDILSPLIDEKPAIDEALEKLSTFCTSLKDECFDLVVNLSFSAFSSYLAKQVEAPLSKFHGYTRFDDGYLSIPDDASAYFYAQVGVGRSNRIHITDLFAQVAGVDLTESDWFFLERPNLEKGDEFIVLHIGASTLNKTLSWSKWLQVVKGLHASPWVGTVVLIGSMEEVEIANQIVSVFGDRKPVNLVGQTSLSDLFQIVSEATLLIGGDSAPVQMASLASTPVLNISFPSVCFWETGPRSKGSRILPIAAEEAISAEEIVTEALALVFKKPTHGPVIRVLGPTIPYVETRPQSGAFEWDLVCAMYLSEEFPAPADDLFLLAMKRLSDVNQLALEQIGSLKKNFSNKMASAILTRVDELMTQISNMVPAADILVRWFRTERLRIGPMPIDNLVFATETLHRSFAHVIAIYSHSDDVTGGAKTFENEGDDGDDVILE